MSEEARKAERERVLAEVRALFRPEQFAVADPPWRYEVDRVAWEALVERLAGVEAPPAPKQVRFVFDAPALAALDVIIRKTRATTHLEALRDALGIYSALLEVQAERGPNAKLGLLNEEEGSFEPLYLGTLT